MTRRPPASQSPATAVPALPFRTPSLTRSASARAQRLREEALKGNARAMRSGIFAEVSNRPDVANEIALIFATHSHLDPLADRRLVEALALALVQQRRAIVAMQTEGMTSILTSYESRLAALSERLERAVHERDQQRAAAKGKAGAVDLSRYGQPASEPKT